VHDGSGALIASLSGRVAAVSPDGAVVEVGGIGLAVQCTPGTIARLQVGEQARLATSLIVREDSLTLYGFADDDERQLFELLQTANGVGQGAERLVLELRDRLGATSTDTQLDGGALPAGAGPITPVAPWRDQLSAALVGLGWNIREADSAVSALAPVADEQLTSSGRIDVAVLLRQALQMLGRS
jgi:Holliday junction DNA helicase RuvA